MSSGSSTERKSAPPPRAVTTKPSHPLHPRSFKLRFALQREPGRSYVSPVKPFGIPATVTDKTYVRGGDGVEGDAEGEGEGDGRREKEKEEEELTARALARIQEMVTRGPRERHPAPVTSAQQYGWWWERIAALEQVSRRDRRLHHHIQDSQWLKERMRVLAADHKLNH